MSKAAELLAALQELSPEELAGIGLAVADKTRAVAETQGKPVGAKVNSAKDTVHVTCEPDWTQGKFKPEYVNKKGNVVPAKKIRVYERLVITHQGRELKGQIMLWEEIPKLIA